METKKRGMKGIDKVGLWLRYWLEGEETPIGDIWLNERRAVVS